MWALIVLILGSTPPQGTIKHGFDTEAACKEGSPQLPPQGW
mgnify:CR=1 FL=1